MQKIKLWSVESSGSRKATAVADIDTTETEQQGHGRRVSRHEHRWRESPPIRLGGTPSPERFRRSEARPQRTADGRTPLDDSGDATRS